VLQYAAYREAEKRRDVVLVFTDESYIHQGYCSKWGWFHFEGKTTESSKATHVRGSEKGKRLIISMR